MALNRNYCRSVTIQTLGLKAYPYDALGAKRACIRWAHTRRRGQPHAKIKRPRWRVLMRSHTLPSFEAGGYSDG